MLNIISGTHTSNASIREVSKRTSSKSGGGATVVCTALYVSNLITLHNINCMNTIRSNCQIECCDNQQHTDEYYSNFVHIESGGARMSKEYYDNHRVLNEIAALPYNWNDNGADAFSPELIQRSRHLIERLQRQPMIFPTANDSIQFEYEKDNGDYLEFELFENGKCKLFHCDADNKSERRFINDADINKEVNQFYGRSV